MCFQVFEMRVEVIVTLGVLKMRHLHLAICLLDYFALAQTLRNQIDVLRALTLESRLYFLMFLLGCVGMAALAPLKTFILNASRDAPNLASTLSSSSLNFGVAVGATICSVALAWGLGYGELPWLGVACSLAGLAVIEIAMRQARRSLPAE